MHIRVNERFAADVAARAEVWYSSRRHRKTWGELTDAERAQRIHMFVVMIERPPGGRHDVKILRDVGSHEQRMRKSPRMKSKCPTCKAMPGERCVNVNLRAEGIKAYTRGFHSARVAPKVKRTKRMANVRQRIVDEVEERNEMIRRSDETVAAEMRRTERTKQQRDA